MVSGVNASGGIDVAYVAHLARLKLTESEISTFQTQLRQIVSYVHKISELDLSGVEPTAFTGSIRNVFRADKVKTSLDRDRILRNAPAVVDDQFSVPRIVE